MKHLRILLVFVVLLTGQSLTQAQGAQTDAAASGVSVPRGYVIGQDDDLSVKFWRETDLSADVTVRPDGKISLPLLNDVQAEGYTPEALNELIAKAASKFISDPSVTVIVKAIRSRKVYVIGEVGKPGAVPLNGDMNVLQLIATVGGLLEYADKDNIVIVRLESGKEHRLKFAYGDVIRGKNLKQNILLKPGDTLIVP
jgi:polysaccharide biosynthesis/export protein